MPIDLGCRKCNLSMTLGWYHYHTNDSGYWARTAFACSRCGTTHYIEHANDGKENDRCLCHERPSIISDRDASLPPGEPTVYQHPFQGFNSFVCPVCQAVGEVVTFDDDKPTNNGPVPCVSCGKQLDELCFWVS